MSITRRDLLRFGAGLGAGAVLAGSRLRLPLALAGDGPAAGAKAKACILLFMQGGPSHIDTFDPKPGADTGGPFGAIETSAKDVKISQHLPRLAQQAHRMTILRSLHSREADHDRASYLLHTGYRPEETVVHPACGCVVSHQLPRGELPSFVAIGEAERIADPSYLGAEHAPLVVNPEDPAAGLEVPEHLRRRTADRRSLLAAMDRRLGERTDPARVADDVAVRERAEALLGRDAVDAFDVEREDARVREAYGESDFGRGCLVARRLVERGVRFVEVTLDGWDTHEENFGQVEELSRQLDPAFAQLLADLDDRELLEQTMVVWMGEFGRTPEINAERGRDHWSAAFSAVLAGGGFGRGRAVGATDARGAEVTDRPVSVPDLWATIYTQLGIDPARQLTSEAGRPIKLVDGGQVVKELLD